MIVTGAGRGLGRGIAGAIARAGGEVIGVSRSISQLEETAAGIGAGRFRSLPADVSRLEDLGGLVADAWSHGPVHGIVHGAGIQLRKPALEVSPEDWRSVQAVHVEAPFFLSTALARRQLEEGLPGSHVFVGSLANSIGLRNVAPYVAAKSALMGVVRTLALEWAETGIRVNAVGPGYFLTDLTRELLSDPEQHARVLSRIPMSRLGTPEDLGGAFVFLLADASSYMTGQLVNVDGGWLAG